MTIAFRERIVATVESGYLSVEQFEKNVSQLVGDFGGLVRPARESPRLSGAQEISTISSPVADVNFLHPHIRLSSGGSIEMSGAGSGKTREEARVKAVCEALERYCSCCFDPGQQIVASANELGADAVDLDLYAIGSKLEYANPISHSRPPDKSLPLRWVRAVSLISGARKWVPLLSVYLSSRIDFPGESFLQPISTGCAIAANYEKAVWTGLCEVVERDAISLTWLQELPLPEVAIDGIDSSRFWSVYRELKSAGIEQKFYNATTDIGVPTVYGVQRSAHGLLKFLVMAATRPTIIDAMTRIMEEAVPQRSTVIQVEQSKPRLFDPANFSTFVHLEDGARFYADGVNDQACKFLFAETRSQNASDIPSVKGKGPREHLETTLKRFAELGYEAYAADITVPAVRDAGLVAVKVIAPQLLPLTTNYNLRYLATPRLYEAPVRMGYAAKPESKINPWPQPFA
jgi:ribosomal protein S12 methylthiotransferase accessory factor